MSINHSSSAPLKGAEAKRSWRRVLAFAIVTVLLAFAGRGLALGYDSSDEFSYEGVTSAIHTDGSKNSVFSGESVWSDVQSLPNAFVVGGFDLSRGGVASFPSGSYFTGARASLSANFPQSSLTSFATLTSSTLTGVDIAILSSPTSNTSHITPLSATEQNALIEFVESGGCAILLPDNSSFGGSGTDAANESLIDPFDMDIGGTLSGGVTATVNNPSSHSITSGSFGTFSTFSQNYPGAFTDLGPYATSLATNPLGEALAVIEGGQIASGSGGVVVYSDMNAFGNVAGFFSQNEGLFLNTIQFCLDSATDLLSLYALAFDNEPTDPANLSPIFHETMDGIVAGSEGHPDKRAVVLVDQDGESDTRIFVVHDGEVTPIVGLPDSDGVLSTSLNEYDMADGNALGGFLKWARSSYGAAETKTTFSYLGHGTFLAPAVDLSTVFPQRAGGSAMSGPLFPLPYMVRAHPDLTDAHSNALITPHALQVALDVGTNGGSDPIEVLDIVHCFGASLERWGLAATTSSSRRRQATTCKSAPTLRLAKRTCTSGSPATCGPPKC